MHAGLLACWLAGLLACLLAYIIMRSALGCRVSWASRARGGGAFPGQVLDGMQTVLKINQASCLPAPAASSHTPPSQLALYLGAAYPPPLLVLPALTHPCEASFSI